MFSKVLSKLKDRRIEEIAQLQAKKRELELENESLHLDLKNSKRKQEMEMTDATLRFDRLKEIWKQDQARLAKELDEDKKRMTKHLTEEFALKEREAIAVLKLDSEQKSKQLELDYQRKSQEKDAKHALEIQKLKTDHANDKMTYQTKMVEEHYKKLSEALTHLHSEGNANTKFVQELALKMLEKPVGANVHESRVLLRANGAVDNLGASIDG